MCRRWRPHGRACEIYKVSSLHKGVPRWQLLPPAPACRIYLPYCHPLPLWGLACCWDGTLAVLETASVFPHQVLQACQSRQSQQLSWSPHI